MNNDVVAEYIKLLKIGRGRIEGKEPHDLEPHVLHHSALIQELIELNKYVYTYYSTNAGDKTYSIEFAVLADFAEQIQAKLREKGMWYISKNYKSGDYDEFYDKEEATMSRVEEIIIPRRMQNRYLIKTASRPNGWEVVQDSTLPADEVKLRRNADIHYITDELLEYTRDDYERSNYFLDWSFIEELGKTNRVDVELLSGNIALFIVEDPRIGNSNLYRTLLDIVKDVVKLPSSGGKSPKKCKPKTTRRRKNVKSVRRKNVHRFSRALKMRFVTKN